MHLNSHNHDIYELKVFIKKRFPALKKIISLIRRKNKLHYLISCISFCKCFLFLKINYNKNVVVICLIEHIGDIIANEPIAREVRKKHPNSKIIWFVRKPYREIIIYNPHINKVFTVRCLTTWIWIKQKFQFEAVYDLHFNERYCKKCNLPLDKENVDNSINSTNYFNFGGLLKAVCLHNKFDVINNAPEVYIPQKTFNSLSKKITFKKYIVIHCSSNESIKNWENNKWVQLIGHNISKYKLPVIEVGTQSYLNYTNTLYYNYCNKLKLLETAALIRNAALFIGVDSGPAHMANAAGTPGIVLLGEYLSGMKNYNPYSGNYGERKNCKIIYSESFVKDIPIENVLNNIESLFDELKTN